MGARGKSPMSAEQANLMRSPLDERGAEPSPCARIDHPQIARHVVKQTCHEV